MRLLTVMLTATFAMAAPAFAATRTSFEDVQRDVMCVTCGVPLVIADSPAADTERQEIRRLVDQGLTKRQVEDQLVAIYGARVLALPRSGGVAVTAYIVPAVLVLLAGGLVAGAARRWRRSDGGAPDTPAPGITLAPDDEQRVAADLAHYEP